MNIFLIILILISVATVIFYPCCNWINHCYVHYKNKAKLRQWYGIEKGIRCYGLPQKFIRFGSFTALFLMILAVTSIVYVLLKDCSPTIYGSKVFATVIKRSQKVKRRKGYSYRMLYLLDNGQKIYFYNGRPLKVGSRKEFYWSSKTKYKVNTTDSWFYWWPLIFILTMVGIFINMLIIHMREWKLASSILKKKKKVSVKIENVETYSLKGQVTLRLFFKLSPLNKIGFADIRIKADDLTSKEEVIGKEITIYSNNKNQYAYFNKFDEIG